MSQTQRSESNNEKRHNLSCAILQMSITLLLSGLERIIKDNLSSKMKYSSGDIFSCCYVGLLTLWEPALRDSLVLLVKRCILSTDLRAIRECVVGSAFIVDSVNSAQTTSMNAAVDACTGETGRQISSRHDREVERGTVIIQEEPFLATVISECKCREGASADQ